MSKLTQLGLPIYLLVIYIIFTVLSAGGSIEKLKLGLKLKNIEIIDSYVDFGSIQESWKRQIKLEIIHQASLNTPTETNRNNLNQLSLASNLIEEYTDLYVSKAGLVKLFSVLEERKPETHETKASRLYTFLSSDKFIDQNKKELTSWDKLEMDGYDSKGRKYTLKFTFNFFRWILTDITFDISNIFKEEFIDFVISNHLYGTSKNEPTSLK